MILDYGTFSRNETKPKTITILKQKGWVERPDAPATTNTEIAEWNGSQWVVRSLTNEEQETIDAKNTETALRESVKSILADIKAGTGTAQERILRLEKAVHYIAKRIL